MTEWFVELQASERDIRFLMISLGSGGISIFEEAGSAFLRAPKMLSGMSHSQAHDIAIVLLETINGAAKVLNPSYEGIFFKAIGFRDEQKEIKRHYILHAQAGRYVLHASGQNDPTLTELVNLTTTIPAVAKALTLYGSLAHNWKNLYMVMEVIEDDLGGESAVISSYPEMTRRWKDCKWTANSFGAIGREARHATDHRTPHNPMQIEEAQELVRQVLFHWLSTKIIDG
jgi:hypothetical protein